jgi:hypothetical protein
MVEPEVRGLRSDVDAASGAGEKKGLPKFGRPFFLSSFIYKLDDNRPPHFRHE